MKKYSSRDVICYTIGIPLVALGNALYVKSALGISVASSLAYVVSRKATFLTYGVWSYLMQGATVLVMIALVRRVKPVYLLSFLSSVLQGYLIDFFSWCLSGVQPVSLAARLPFFVGGFLALAGGVAVTLLTRLPIPPFDLFIREVSLYRDVSVKRVKTTFDLTVLSLSVALSFLLYGSIAGVGAGTLVIALVNGTAIQFFKRGWSRLLRADA